MSKELHLKDQGSIEVSDTINLCRYRTRFFYVEGASSQGDELLGRRRVDGHNVVKVLLRRSHPDGNAKALKKLIGHF
jgi:hypothetical protein